MRPHIAIIILFLTFTFSLTAVAQVESKKHGVWSNPEIWKGNKVPTQQDNILIKHHIKLDSSMLFVQQVTVEKKGQICGEVDITIVSGTLVNHGLIRVNQFTFQSNFINSGILEVRKMKTNYWKGFTNTGKVRVNKEMEIDCKH